MPRLSLSTAIGVFLAAALGCSSADLVLPDEGLPSSVVVVRGDQQTGAAGATLPDSVVVRVTDTKGRPVVGQMVVFALGAGATGGDVAPDTVSTGVDGRASARWTLGSAAGAQTLTARVVGTSVPDNLTTSVSATAGAGGAAGMSIAQGDGQSGIAGTQLADSLVVLILDANGNPVPGVDVAWAATGGGSASAPTVATGADGRAGILRTLGAVAGPQTTTASAAGVPGSPLVFHATGSVGSPGRLVLATPPSSSAQSGAPFAQQPRVQLRDANNNVVATPGVAVTAGIATGPGGALVGSTTVATDAAGLATFSGLGISGSGGSYTLRFTGSGLVEVVSPAITVSAGSATQLTLTTQPSANAQSGVPFAQQPVVQLLDASGNPVPDAGVSITAAVATGGGTLGGTSTHSTDANGRAAFTNLSISGSAGSHTLAFIANGLAAATSNAIALSGSSAVSGLTSTVSAAPTSFVAGSGSSTITVVARDLFSSKVGGATVTFSVSGTGNSMTTAPATDANGTTSATLTSTVAGTKVITATINGVTVVQTATVDVTAQAASSSRSSVAVSPGTITASSGGSASTVTVTVRDASGVPLPSVSVSLAATGGSNAINPASATSNASGVASFRLTSTKAELKTITATAGGVTVAQTGAVTVQPGAASAAQSTASVPDGRRNHDTIFSVQTRDSFGNPLTTTAGAVNALVTGRNFGKPVTITDNDDGTYTGMYRPTASGTDSINILLGLVPIGGSPYSSTVDR